MAKVAVMFDKGNVSLERILINVIKLFSIVMLLIWVPVTLWISLQLWAELTQPGILTRWIVLFVFPDVVFLTAFLRFIHVKTAVVKRVDAQGNVTKYFVEDEMYSGGGGLKKVLIILLVLVLLGALAGGGWWYFTNGRATPMPKAPKTVELEMDWQVPAPVQPPADVA